MSGNCEASIQTDEDLIYTYAWQKFYHHFQHAASDEIKNESKKGEEITELKEKINSINISPDTSINNEQIYELKNGIYFDTKHGLYYDPEKKLYFDPDDKHYYQYKLNERMGTYYMRFHSRIPAHDWKILSRKLEIAHDKETPDDSFILESDVIKPKHQKIEEDDWIHDKYEELEMEDLVGKYPPCIRAILIEASHDSTCKLGSLFLIPYTGGSFGRDSASNLINFDNESDIDKIHAVVGYDLGKKEYFIEDKNSQKGTRLNETILDSNKKYQITHGDKLQIGKNCLLLHIHNGTTTCLNCEPGEVMAKLGRTKLVSKSEIENSRRESNREMKKKYGLKWNNLDSKVEFSENNDHKKKYIDKAKLRRETSGVDTSHVPMEESASVRSAIKDTNIGFKLLKGMGWTEGKGLGRLENGIIEPVNAKVRVATSGLGHENSEVSMDAGESEKMKKINWNKARNRYAKIDLKTQSNLSNVFNVESDDEEN